MTEILTDSTPMPNAKSIIRLDIAGSDVIKYLYTWGQAMDYLKHCTLFEHMVIRQDEHYTNVIVY